jgi:hypothetical protein
MTAYHSTKMNTATALAILAIVAALGLATAAFVPILPQAQAIGYPGYGPCNHPGSEQEDHRPPFCIPPPP